MKSLITTIFLFSILSITGYCQDMQLQYPDYFQQQELKIGFDKDHSCGFDQHLAEMKKDDSLKEIFLQNSELLRNAIKKAKSSSSTRMDDIYVLPVVVHVMDPGTGNFTVTTDQVDQTIDDLNADFGPSNIQFCLAARDPTGNFSTGINYVDASNICAGGQCYPNGMPISGPLELAVKGASLWPNTDYVNIWVVHSIIGAIGYATFPGEPAVSDGIVMDDDYFGVGGSNVVSHEVGHFLNLFHSFEGDCPNGGCNVDCTAAECPPSDPSLGDEVMDTPPHIRSCFDCDPSGTNDCDGNSPNSLFVPNYMNYSSPACLSEFTAGQTLRMRTTVTTVRSPLLNSLGCVPGCTSVIADFDPSVLGGIVGITIDFMNTSIGGNTYLWEVEGTTSPDFHFSHEFNNQGTFLVCLTASNPDCTNKHCVLVEITGPDPCFGGFEFCNVLLNGNLEQNSYGLGVACHFFNGNACYDNSTGSGVCNWDRKYSSPAFCSDQPGANSFILLSWANEAFVTTMPTDLVDGQSYTLSYRYFHVAPSFNLNGTATLHAGLTQSSNIGAPYPFGEPIRTLSTVEDAGVDAIGIYVDCPPLDAQFHPEEVLFTYNAGDPTFVFFSFDGVGPQPNQSYMHIRDIVITDCNQTCVPEPDIVLEQEDCTLTVTGVNTGDIGICYWDFGDNTTATGCDATHTYTTPGTYNVCLTIVCDEYGSASICKTVTVEDCVPDCITVDLVEVTCKNQGTTDPSDDKWCFKIIVTDNSGDGVYWTSTGDVIENGSYGEIKPVLAGGTILSNPTVTMTIFDAENTECATIFTVNAPEACSDSCKLEVKYDVTECFDNGTDGYVSDDYYKINLDISGTMGLPFMVKQKFSNGDENVLFQDAGDQAVELTLFSQEGDFTLWVFYSDYFDCIVDIYIDAPATCSGCLDVVVTNIQCYNNGTSDPDDDYWTFDITVDGGSSYWTTDGLSPEENGGYDDIKTIWMGAIGDGTPITFAIYDHEEPECEITLTVTPPESCSTECKLEIKELITTCKEMEGGVFYVVDLYVDVEEEQCFMVKKKNADGSEEILGTYNGPQSLTYGPYNPGEEFTLWVMLCETFDCVRDFYIRAPEDCNNCIDYSISNVTCYDNGTSDPEDDYWTFDITAHGPGNYWTAGNPINDSGSYDDPKTIWVGSISDNPQVSFVIIDDENEGCNAIVSVQAPEPCSEECNLEVTAEVSDCREGEGKEFYFTVTLNVQIDDEQCFIVKKKNEDGSEEILGTYYGSQNITLGNFAEGEDFTLWIMGCETFDCTRDIYINAPDCRDGERNIISTRLQIDNFINLSPNPVYSELNIAVANKTDVSYRIFNIDGKFISKGIIKNGKHTLDVSTFEEGMYILKAIDIDGTMNLKKFIVIK